MTEHGGKPNGVPRWVDDKFERLEEDILGLHERLRKLEELNVDLRIWQGKMMVWGILGTVLLNGFVTLLISLFIRRLAAG